MSLTSFIVRRLLLLVPVLLGISLIVFGLMALVPGDAALAILGPYATAERVLELRRSLGLDEPLPVRYVLWLANLVRGDLGYAYSLQRPVLEAVLDHLGATLLLAAAALGVGALLGLALGATAAAHRGRWPDRALTLAALVGISTPAFWLSMLLMMAFAVWWRAFPASGMYAAYGGQAGTVADLFRHLTLPALSLGLVAAGVIARMTRTEMLEALGEGYVRTARAKGLREGEVLYRHALHGALPRIVPVIGLQAGFVLGGAVYVETVFEWPGLGRLLVEAVRTRDLLLAQGGVLVVAASYVLVNLATDVIQRALDPRVES